MSPASSSGGLRSTDALSRTPSWERTTERTTREPSKGLVLKVEAHATRVSKGTRERESERTRDAARDCSSSLLGSYLRRDDDDESLFLGNSRARFKRDPARVSRGARVSRRARLPARQAFFRASQGLKKRARFSARARALQIGYEPTRLARSFLFVVWHSPASGIVARPPGPRKKRIAARANSLTLASPHFGDARAAIRSNHTHTRRPFERTTAQKTQQGTLCVTELPEVLFWVGETRSRPRFAPSGIYVGVGSLGRRHACLFLERAASTKTYQVTYGALELSEDVRVGVTRAR